MAKPTFLFKRELSHPFLLTTFQCHFSLIYQAQKVFLLHLASLSKCPFPFSLTNLNQNTIKITQDTKTSSLTLQPAPTLSLLHLISLANYSYPSLTLCFCVDYHIFLALHYISKHDCSQIDYAIMASRKSNHKGGVRSDQYSEK